MKTYILRRKPDDVTKYEVTNAGLFSVYRWFGGQAAVMVNDDRMEDILWRNRDGWSIPSFAEEFPDVHTFLYFVSAARMSDEQAIEVLSAFFTSLTTYKEAIKP